MEALKDQVQTFERLRDGFQYKDAEGRDQVGVWNGVPQGIGVIRASGAGAR